EWVTTPAAFCSGLSWLMALYAPRNLKAPTRWKFSHFRKIWQPARASSVRDVCMGVRWAMPRSRSAAAATSESVSAIRLPGSHILDHLNTPEGLEVAGLEKAGPLRVVGGDVLGYGVLRRVELVQRLQQRCRNRRRVAL